MYTKKKCKIYVLSVLLCTFFFSCSSIDFELPQGPQEPMANPLMRYGKKKLKPVI